MLLNGGRPIRLARRAGARRVVLIRILLIALILWVAWRVVRYLLTSSRGRRTTVVDRGRMVVCKDCGVYLPETDAVRIDDRTFRCRKH